MNETDFFLSFGEFKKASHETFAMWKIPGFIHVHLWNRKLHSLLICPKQSCAGYVVQTAVEQSGGMIWQHAPLFRLSMWKKKVLRIVHWVVWMKSLPLLPSMWHFVLFSVPWPQSQVRHKRKKKEGLCCPNKHLLGGGHNRNSCLVSVIVCVCVC